MNKIRVLAAALLWSCFIEQSVLADNSLVAHWPLDEGVGFVAQDASSFDAAGQLINRPTWVSALIGWGLQFDGRDDYIDIGDPINLQLTSSMTIALWVLPEHLTQPSTLIAKNGGFGDVGWALYLEKGYPMLKIGQPNPTNSKTSTRTSSAPLTVGQWHHVAGVFNAGQRTLDIYVDGVLSNGLLNGAVPNAQRNSGQNINVGRRPRNPYNTTVRYFKGTLDDIRIYSRALSPQELETLAQGTEPTPEQPFREQYEAERSVLLNPLRVAADPGANSGAYIAADSGKPTKSPVREGFLAFTLPVDGTYYLWARMKALSGASDAIYVGIDQSWDRIYPKVKNQYQWVRVRTRMGSAEYGFYLSAGQHVVQIGHGEIGARLDSFLLTSDPSEVPR
jgi:Concanavalin A-like lectin/glucanases superfamily